MFKLYDYFRSSACFRVRIALNLKEQPYESLTIHLVKEGGQHLHEAYRALNPQALVPALEEPHTGQIMTQSLAIIEYLDETIQNFPLLPTEPIERAHVRAFAQAVACDIHPLNNLRVLKYLTGTLHLSENQKTAWYQHWIKQGFEGLEKIIENHASKGPFCFGKSPTLADICLVPQVYNALRYEYGMSNHPLLHGIYQHCLTLPPFIKALPENQADHH